MNTFGFKKIIILTLLLLSSTALASWQEPSSTSDTRSAPLTTLDSAQWRTEALSLGTSTDPLTNYMLDINGFVKSAAGSVFGDARIGGKITSASLIHSGTSTEICTNANGHIVLCTGGPSTYPNTFVDKTPGGAEQFAVPQGVTEMVVEIWGAGGGGYYYQNTDTGATHNCVSNTVSIDRNGNPTTFVSATNSSYLNLNAGGGRCGYLTSGFQKNYIGGPGGDASASGTLINGTPIVVDGKTGGSGSPGDTFTTITCPHSDTLVLGGRGGSGGSGGASGPIVSFTPEGGKYALGSTVICFTGSSGGLGVNNPVSGPYPPDVSISSDPGTGGSGAPGTAGETFLGYSFGDCGTARICDGGRGTPGGGGGGYIKAVVSVSGGEVYNYSVGSALQNSSSYGGPAGFTTCSSGWKTVFNCGSLSGYGAHGQVKISY